MTDRLANEPTEALDKEEFEIFDLANDDPEPNTESAPSQEQQTSATAGEDNQDLGGAEEAWMKKYKGKEASDLIQMHREMEVRYSQLANDRYNLSKEVERLNQLSKDLSGRELDNAGTSEGSDIDELIFDKPSEAINKAISSNPLIKDLLTQRANESKMTAKKALYAAHEDFDTTSSSKEFAEWVSKSAYRQRKVQEASASEDYVLAAELMSEFKDMYGSSREAGLASRNESLGKIAPVRKSTAGSGSAKKVKYRASQIRELYNKNPAKYEAMSAKIRQAYAEGRVIED